MKKIINIPINPDILKIIAILTMTIDHFGYIFTPSFEVPLRLIGRISFPIFAFLLAYNLTQKDLFKKYIFRLSIFAVITSLILIPFKYQIGNILPLNIFWTLLLSVVSIYTILSQPPSIIAVDPKTERARQSMQNKTSFLILIIFS